MPRTTQHHHLQDPVHGLYYTETPDGTPALTTRPEAATRFQTSAHAVEYATHRLAGQSCEVVRV